MGQSVGAIRMCDVYDKINAQWRPLGLLVFEIVTVRRSLGAGEQRDINSLCVFVKTHTYTHACMHFTHATIHTCMYKFTQKQLLFVVFVIR